MIAVAAAGGEVLELTVTEPAHGGWCVARGAAPGEAGKVGFVRHALPGERVRAWVTSSTARFARAEAVEILRPSPDRVAPPCPYARPGGCGGCDLQHARPAASARSRPRCSASSCAASPASTSGCGWTRCRATRPGWAGAPRSASRSARTGRPGCASTARARSSASPHCLIAHPLVREAGVPGRRWPRARGVEVTISPGSGQRSVTVSGPGPAPGGRARPWLRQHAAGRTWRVSSGVFWQVHPAAAGALTGAVLAALDLYCGAGLFAAALAGAARTAGRAAADRLRVR